MDIQTGLTIAGSAIDLIKSLRQLDHDLDKADLKSKLAELYEQVADVKMALVDANTKIKELENLLEEKNKGESCPLCNTGRMKITSSKPHKHFAFAGVQMRQIKCDNCGHSEERLFDPRKQIG